MRSWTKPIYIVLSAALLLGATWAVASFFATQKVETGTSGEDGLSSGVELIQGYRQWTRVNPVPAIFHSRIAAACAPPTADQSRMEANNPHRDKFITVYVNDIGRHAMMEQKIPVFPQGSIIIKEKLSNRESSAPELLTGMRKREAGYNPDNGDWEYIALDGTGKSVQARGKLETCQACHMMVKDTDYVSRNYLPYDVRQKLK